MLGDRVSHVRSVLTDAAGERKDVDASQGHRHVSHCSGDPVRVDRERERVVEAAEGREPRLVLERRVELVDAQAALAQEVEERARIDRARARRHRHALERGEAHGRVDRAAVQHGGHRAAAAEVADDEPRGDRHLLRDAPLHREPVEAVAADAPSSRHSRGTAYVDASWRNRRVERRVEDGDVRHVRERVRAPRSIAARAGALWSGASSASSSIVSRRPRRRSAPARGSEAAVHDAMPDGVDPRAASASDRRCSRLVALDDGAASGSSSRR